MSLLNRLFIPFFNKKVGHDKYGNIYYQSSNKANVKFVKRYVLYNGSCEPSKVSPMWHAWLRHALDEVPVDILNYSWQQDYLPNLTGTMYSYNPQINNNLRNAKVLGYNNWQPK
ncbi:MAG: hypothetical protein EOP33_00370 [Rickettsiaceae bacterium]|nr:MAG: hypothetical protein EOP33_00370 [Rickettsiaceae bacterium]